MWVFSIRMTSEAARIWVAKIGSRFMRRPRCPLNGPHMAVFRMCLGSFQTDDVLFMVHYFCTCQTHRQRFHWRASLANVKEAPRLRAASNANLEFVCMCILWWWLNQIGPDVLMYSHAIFLNYIFPTIKSQVKRNNTCEIWYVFLSLTGAAFGDKQESKCDHNSPT